MDFPPGKPIAALLAVALLSGAATLAMRASDPPRADLVLWTFDDARRAALLADGSALRGFERRTGLRVDVRRVQFRALNTRLGLLAAGEVRGPEVPDAVNVEVTGAGRLFAPPLAALPLRPLDDLLAGSPLRDEIPPARLESWSKGGAVVAVPLTVHPTVIAYDAPLFEEAGVDLAGSESWDDFAERCRAARRYWRIRGGEERFALEMPQNNSSLLVALLIQRGVNLIDARGALHLDDPRVLETTLWYCEQVAGEEPIGGQPSDGEQALAIDFADGRIAAVVAADWRLDDVRRLAPNLAGDVRVMPLPRWPDSPARTSTIGGTAIAIPRNARDPRLSLSLIEAIAPDAQGAASLVVPAATTRSAADASRDPFFSGQPVRELLATLAAETPTRVISAGSSFAEVALGQVLLATARDARSRGGVDDAVRDACRDRLADAQRLVRARLDHLAQGDERAGAR